MKKLWLVWLLSIALAAAISDHGFSQDHARSGLEAALAKEGLSAKDLDAVITYYYQNPQPGKLIAVVRAMLSQDRFISDAAHFEPFAHFVGTVAHNNRGFLDAMKEMRRRYSGAQEKALGRMISEAEDFRSPLPDSPKNLDFLWAEFSATGSEEPVEKILSIVGSPGIKSLDSEVTKSAAGWSLGLNARQHKKVYDIIKRKLDFSTGDLKNKLEDILKGGPGAGV